MEKLTGIHQEPWLLSPRTFFVHKKFSLTILKIQYLFIQTTKHLSCFVSWNQNSGLCVQNPDWEKIINAYCLYLLNQISIFGLYKPFIIFQIIFMELLLTAGTQTENTFPETSIAEKS